MSRKRNAAASRAASAPEHGAKPRLGSPVRVRPRHDGWSPEKQVDFIEALAESGCVAHACERVGMQPQSAYMLRRRIDAQSFRFAWDMALDYAVQRLAEAALSRAIHGVAVPVFYQGEQIGERRHFDERLTRFLLRCRDPVRYGAWIDRMVEARRHPDGAASLLSRAMHNLEDDAMPRRRASGVRAIATCRSAGRAWTIWRMSGPPTWPGRKKRAKRRTKRGARPSSRPIWMRSHAGSGRKPAPHSLNFVNFRVRGSPSDAPLRCAPQMPRRRFQSSATPMRWSQLPSQRVSSPCASSSTTMSRATASAASSPSSQAP